MRAHNDFRTSQASIWRKSVNRAFGVWLGAWLVVAGAWDPAHAQGKPATKVTDDLKTLHAEHLAAAESGTAQQWSHPFLPAAGDWVTLDAVASGDPSALAADLLALGAQDIVTAGRVVSARLPIPAIPTMDTLASLEFARPAYAVTNVGLVTSQGDRAMRADIARRTFGVDGTGVNVGVLSDSFNCKGGAAADVANNDLSPVTVLQESPTCASGTDEGRAMLQIVHDIAPGASLAFATANGGMANFANNIIALRDAGARVIVDDVIYLAEPMFQDGIIAQTVDAVVASGVAYFSSAGNYARQAYDHAFVPGTVYASDAFPSAPGVPPFLGGTAHDFGGGNPRQRIAFPGGTSLILSLQWDSPFFSISGNPGTQNDLDIYVLDSTGTQVVAAVTTNNLVSKDPVEILNGVSCSPTVVQCVGLLMIVNHAGPNPGRIKYTLFRASPNLTMDFATNSGSLFGHANAAGAVAVGAADYRKTPAFGVSPAVLESFSSAGTTPILFDTAGNRLDTPDLRATKPEIVAPNRADTTFFGSSDPDGTGFPNFAGTSAAAPHAAAVAALILQARPTLTPAQIRAALESTALDMGAPGFDNDTGFGLIQADAALASLGSPVMLTGVTADKTPPQVAGTTITFTASATGGTPPYQFKWWVYDGTMWMVAQDWSASPTFAWTPSAANAAAQLSTWVRSSANLTDTYESFKLTSFAITPLTQVRFLNNLLICNPTCASFTARLTASEGYTWLSTSGTPSAYQVVTTPTLSNFTGEAIGFGASLMFPGTFNLVAGRRYELVAILDATGNSPILLLLDEGLSSASVPQQAGTPTSALPGRRQGDPAVQFAPASQAPVVR